MGFLDHGMEETRDVETYGGGGDPVVFRRDMEKLVDDLREAGL